MNKNEFLLQGNYLCVLEFRNSFNAGVVSLLDPELSFIGSYKEMINHLERYFDLEDIEEMIEDSDLSLFETYNDGQDIIFEVFNGDNDFDDFDRVYIKVVR